MLGDLGVDVDSDLHKTIDEILTKSRRSDNTAARGLLDLLLIIKNDHSGLSNEQAREDIQAPMESEFTKHPLGIGAILIRRRDGMIFKAVVLRFLHGRALSGRVDELAQQPAYRRNHQKRHADQKADMDRCADESVADVQKLVKEEAFPIELGHQGAAAVDNCLVGQPVRRGGHCAQITDGAYAQELLGN